MTDNFDYSLISPCCCRLLGLQSLPSYTALGRRVPRQLTEQLVDSHMQSLPLVQWQIREGEHATNLELVLQAKTPLWHRKLHWGCMD